MNRVWQAYFGTGLVGTSEDLRHAERAAVASRTARLAGRRVHGQRLEPEGAAPADRDVGHLPAVVARHAGAATARDPYNRLLARGPRFRVDAEIVRDIALAASGLLNAKVGGPSVFPPAPDFLFLPPASYGRRSGTKQRAPTAIAARSTRSAIAPCPIPMLQTFDAPNGDISCVRRARSNTPLQALTTLNEPLFLECARALALQHAARRRRHDDASG